jgi:hypothetical protein
MKNSIQIFLLFGLCLYFYACKKVETNPSFIDVPIVQSYLKVDSSITVNVSKLIPFDPNAVYSTDNMNALNINIICNNISHLLNSIGGGNYVNTSLIINDSTNYLLQFNYNGKTISAATKALSRPKNYTQSATEISIAQIAIGASGFGSGTMPPAPITLTWSNPEHSYYILVVQNMESNPVLINLNDTTTTRVFRNQPTQDISSQINSRQFSHYGMHKISLYHVLPDYADLFKNNSTSSQSLTTPTTAINNGLGIFTAINTATLYVNVRKL